MHVSTTCEAIHWLAGCPSVVRTQRAYLCIKTAINHVLAYLVGMCLQRAMQFGGVSVFLLLHAKRTKNQQGAFGFLVFF